MVEPLSCSLVGRDDAVELRPGSTVSRLYGTSSATESFFCNYGLNDSYGAELEKNGLQVTGRGPAGEGRVVELEEHAFFVGTLFLPQARSTPAAPHPVLVGFAEAAFP